MITAGKIKPGDTYYHLNFNAVFFAVGVIHVGPEHRNIFWLNLCSGELNTYTYHRNQFIYFKAIIT